TQGPAFAPGGSTSGVSAGSSTTGGTRPPAVETMVCIPLGISAVPGPAAGGPRRVLRRAHLRGAHARVWRCRTTLDLKVRHTDDRAMAIVTRDEHEAALEALAHDVRDPREGIL